MSGPRFLDVDRAASIRDAALASYRRGAGAFLSFLDMHAWSPRSFEEWGDLLVEFSFSGVGVARFRESVAALEFFFVRLKGNLPWARRRLEDLAGSTPLRHTVPAGYEVCLLLAAWIASAGRGAYCGRHAFTI